MIRKIIYSGIIGVFLSACIKPVDIELPVHESKLVINSFLSYGDSIKVHVSKSVGQMEYLQPSLSLATVVVKTGSLSDTLLFGKDGWYHSEWIAASNTIYQIDVNTQEFENVLAQDTVPGLVDFDLENFIARTAVDDMGNFFSSVDIVIDDDLKEDKFYEIYYQNHDRVRRVDASINGSGIRSKTKEIVEQVDDKTMGTLLFLNEPFQGKSELRLNVEYVYSNNIDSVSIWVRALSEEYFKYKKSMNKHTWGQLTDDIWGGYDIYPLYSNIDNAYGVVAAYAENKKSIYTYSPLEP
ncbi:MAG: DUF4249 domain-containing protein [Prolixibacteraceae bacterium]